MFSDDQPATEITAAQLARGVAGALDRVARGERLVVSRHGQSVALLMPFGDGLDVALAGSERFALLRREAREELEAGVTRAVHEWRRLHGGGTDAAADAVDEVEDEGGGDA